MLDFFTIFSRGGLVLWCFPSTSTLFTSSVNALIRSVLLQERGGGGDAFCHESLALRHRLDNEYELVFVVCYQKVLQLNYVDKFLDDIHREFRDKYKNELTSGQFAAGFDDFQSVYARVLQASESAARANAKRPKEMRTYVESEKSKKTVSSMIVGAEQPAAASSATKSAPGAKSAKNGASAKAPAKAKPAAPAAESKKPTEAPPAAAGSNGQLDEETRLRNLERLAAKKLGGKASKQPSPTAVPSTGSETGSGKRVKQKTVWAGSKLSRAEMEALDRSDDKPTGPNGASDAGEAAAVAAADPALIKQKRDMIGDLKELSVQPVDSADAGDDDSDSDGAADAGNAAPAAGGKSGGGGLFGMFRGLVGSKTLNREDLAPVLDKMRDHLVAKNVAAEIAGKLCDSVAARLEGRTVGAFSTVASTVRSAMTDACLQILSPRRRVDILRDALDAKARGRPYSIVMCGVNGVGKSTNLAKIAFWLIANGCRVLIAACDTFRSGAVEQLRTHVRRLAAAYPPESDGSSYVELYEKGYGKDPAGVAMEALRYASTKRFNVGAAISMTYITGQPIVFVGTGQTYTDLKALSASAVVNTLLR
uniref:SRP54 domain-containing protein n=1 Tax=Macrostomum lignano TaxID=282301 RepID=A0A1I8IGC0_9PLAT